MRLTFAIIQFTVLPIGKSLHRGACPLALLLLYLALTLLSPALSPCSYLERSVKAQVEGVTRAERRRGAEGVAGPRAGRERQAWLGLAFRLAFGFGFGFGFGSQGQGQGQDLGQPEGVAGRERQACRRERRGEVSSLVR